MPSCRGEQPRSSRPLRARPQAEPLEGRSLLSHVSPISTLRAQPVHIHPARQTLGLHVPSAVLGPDAREVDVTLTRSSPAGASGLRKRLTVSFTEDYTPIPADPAGTGHTLFEHPGVSKTVTFLPGQASLTFPVPVPAVPSGFASDRIDMGVSLPFMSLLNWPTTTSLDVFASADKVPPTIVSTILTPQGPALTFSKPMDASTVQNVNSYVVDMLPTTAEFLNGSVTSPEAVAVRAAVYDPATQTVTLTLAEPVDLTRDYNVSSTVSLANGPAFSPSSPSAQVLTDLQANPIDNLAGAFAVTVGRDLWTA